MLSLILGLAAELRRSDELRRQLFPLSEPAPVVSFSEMVSSVMASESLSYGDACSKVSRERPDLYNEFRAQALLEG